MEQVKKYTDENLESRQYGLELLRIISFLLITAVHYLGYSNILGNNNILLGNYVFLTIVKVFSFNAVNIFILITGFFQCNKKLNTQKIFLLLAKTLFLTISIFCISFLFPEADFRIGAIKSFLPISSFHYWFLISYLLLYLLSPFINIVIHHTNRLQHLLLCVIGGAVIFVYFLMNPFPKAEIYLGNHRGICWFVYLYLCGAYFQKYQISKRITRLLPWVTVVVFSMTFCIYYFKSDLLNHLLSKHEHYLLPFILSICFFYMFKNLQINNSVLQKIVTELSACSFFVYLIQEHEMVRHWLWRAWHINSYANSSVLILHFFVSLLSLWPVAYLFHKLFQCFFQTFFTAIYKKAETFVCKKINKYIAGN